MNDSDILDGTLNPIERPSIVPVQQRIDENGAFDQLREYKQNASEDRILKQSRADFVTTGLIPAEERKKELKELEVEANEIVDNVFKERQQSIRYMTLQEILTNTSDAMMGIISDLTNKPKETNWGEYLGVTLTKDNRYTYIGIVLVFFAIYFLLMRR